MSDPVADAQAQLEQLKAQRASVQKQISTFFAPAVQRVEAVAASPKAKVAAFGLAAGALWWAFGLPPFGKKKGGRKK